MNLQVNNVIQTDNFDPSRSLVPLPMNLGDRTQPLDSSCCPSSSQAAGSFINTGRGSLPPNPTDPLNSLLVCQF